jgi:hypothetical protein
MIARTRVVATLVLAVTLAACTTPPVPDPTPTPTSTSTPLTTRASTPGPLNPPEPSITDLEHTPEVQALRHDLTVSGWARLNDLCSTAEYEALIDDSYAGCKFLPLLTTSLSLASIAPESFTPIRVRPLDDGTVQVDGCTRQSNDRWAYTNTHEPFTGPRNDDERYMTYPEEQYVTTYELSPVTAEEQAAVAALGLDAPDLRLRRVQLTHELCDDVEVTIQIFTDWAETELFQRR